MIWQVMVKNCVSMISIGWLVGIDMYWLRAVIRDHYPKLLLDGDLMTRPIWLWVTTKVPKMGSRLHPNSSSRLVICGMWTAWVQGIDPFHIGKVFFPLICLIPAGWSSVDLDGRLVHEVVKSMAIPSEVAITWIYRMAIQVKACVVEIIVFSLRRQQVMAKWF